jgi:hypothetical protein
MRRILTDHRDQLIADRIGDWLDVIEQQLDRAGVAPTDPKARDLQRLDNALALYRKAIKHGSHDQRSLRAEAHLVRHLLQWEAANRRTLGAAKRDQPRWNALFIDAHRALERLEGTLQ